MICSNSSTRPYNLGLPQCFANEAEVVVTVWYHALESDTWFLCKECATCLVEDAERHGYMAVVKPL